MNKKFQISILSIGFALLSTNVFAENDRHRKPPKEAFEACESLSENAACQVETPHGTLQGTCFKPPRKDLLVCKPDKQEIKKMREKRREHKLTEE